MAPNVRSMEGLSATTIGVCQRCLEYSCGRRKLAIRDARGTAKCDVLFGDVPTRRNVRRLNERQHMSVRVRYVCAGEEECHALHSPLIAQHWGQPSADGEDLIRERGRQCIEVREVLARDDLYVTGANRVDVEEGDDGSGLVDQMRMDSAAANSAEEAFIPVAHGA